MNVFSGRLGKSELEQPPTHQGEKVLYKQNVTELGVGNSDYLKIPQVKTAEGVFLWVFSSDEEHWMPL